MVVGWALIYIGRWALTLPAAVGDFGGKSALLMPTASGDRVFYGVNGATTSAPAPAKQEHDHAEDEHRQSPPKIDVDVEGAFV